MTLHQLLVSRSVNHQHLNKVSGGPGLTEFGYESSASWRFRKTKRSSRSNNQPLTAIATLATRGYTRAVLRWTGGDIQQTN